MAAIPRERHLVQYITSRHRKFTFCQKMPESGKTSNMAFSLRENGNFVCFVTCQLSLWDESKEKKFPSFSFRFFPNSLHVDKFNHFTSARRVGLDFDNYKVRRGNTSLMYERLPMGWFLGVGGVQIPVWISTIFVTGCLSLIPNRKQLSCTGSWVVHAVTWSKLLSV